MPTSAANTYNANRLDPMYEAEDAVTLPINLIPGVTLSKGTVLGQVTAAVSEVQSLTITATGGTYTLTYTNPITGVQTATAAIAYNANAAAIASAINTALGGTAVAVTGTGPFTITFSGTGYTGAPQGLLTVGTASLTGGTATISRTTSGSAAGVYKAYSSGASDGSQTPKMILQYDVVVDTLGNVSIGSTASVFGDTRKDAPAYMAGTFDTSKLTGLDANALSTAYWRLISGSVSSGIVRLG